MLYKKLYLILAIYAISLFLHAQEGVKGFDDLKGLVEGLGKGDLSIITKGMKSNNDSSGDNKELKKDNVSTTESKEKESISKQFRKDQKGLKEALNKLSNNEDSELSGIGKSFQGILGQGDEINNVEVQKQQQQYLDILTDSLIDLLTAQNKFMVALDFKKNIAITNKALEDLKNGKGGNIPIEQIETAIEVSKANQVMINIAVENNKNITAESKEIFSSGLEDYGRGTKKMLNVGMASKEYLASLGDFNLGMFANLEGILFLVENLPALTKTFLSSTDGLVKYSNNNTIKVPKEISSIEKDKAKDSMADFN